MDIAVHPWMISLREDIIGAKIVAGDGRNMHPEEARTTNWMISVKMAPTHEIFTHKQWLSYHTRYEPIDDAATRAVLQDAARVRATKQQ